MTYGTKRYKNGKLTAIITFSTGKRVFLNEKERAELEEKLNYYKQAGRESFINDAHKNSRALLEDSPV